MTEADLCSWFQDRAREAGFVVYNEWGGFDQILVIGGIQIGVEAKLRATHVVLDQATKRGKTDQWTRLPQRFWSTHFRAVLVPKAGEAFLEAADRRCALVFAQETFPEDPALAARFWALPTDPRYVWGSGIDLPEVVPDVIGGHPAPLRLTPWKIPAIKLCLRLRDQGFVTVQDFRDFGIDPGRWRHQWLVPDGKLGRATKWIPKPGVRLPDEQHPAVAEQLRAGT